jgi:hypothetical protein
VISIDRSRGVAPARLISDGSADLPRIEGLVAAGTLESRDFRRAIYSSDEVRDALWHMQHTKCCFCEHDYEKKNSTVEHFRPKTSALARNRAKEPGYWWLAYEFDNLYFCSSAVAT